MVNLKIALYYALFFCCIWDQFSRNKTGVIEQKGASLVYELDNISSNSINSSNNGFFNFFINNNSGSNNYDNNNNNYDDNYKPTYSTILIYPSTTSTTSTNNNSNSNNNYYNISKFNNEYKYTENVRNILSIELNEFVDFIEKSIPNEYLYKSIYSRVKTIDSMNKKEIKRSKLANKPVHWSEIYDQCGISIIVNPNYNSTIIVDHLKELEIISNSTFKIMEIEKKENKFGYRAHHIDIEFTTKYRTTKIEVQIRTVYEDIISNLAHEFYKQHDIDSTELPILPQVIEFKSFLLYIAENKFSINKNNNK